MMRWLSEVERGWLVFHVRDVNYDPKGKPARWSRRGKQTREYPGQKPLVSRPIILRVLRERLEKDGSDTQGHILSTITGRPCANSPSGQVVRSASPESPLAADASNLAKGSPETWKRRIPRSRRKEETAAQRCRPGTGTPNTRVGGADGGAYSEDPLAVSPSLVSQARRACSSAEHEFVWIPFLLTLPPCPIQQVGGAYWAQIVAVRIWLL